MTAQTHRQDISQKHQDRRVTMADLRNDQRVAKVGLTGKAMVAEDFA